MTFLTYRFLSSPVLVSNCCAKRIAANSIYKYLWDTVTYNNKQLTHHNNNHGTIQIGLDSPGLLTEEWFPVVLAVVPTSTSVIRIVRLYQSVI